MALLLSAVEMLRYIDLSEKADIIEKALYKTLQDGIKTADIGGSAKCSEFTQAIIENIKRG